MLLLNGEQKTVKVKLEFLDYYHPVRVINQLHHNGLMDHKNSEDFNYVTRSTLLQQLTLYVSEGEGGKYVPSLVFENLCLICTGKK